MVVNAVTVHVKPKHTEDFIAATLKNHKGSRQEAGNRRFDVLQSAQDPCRFLLYEVFDSEAAVAAHRQSPHYLEWKQAVEPWMAAPREGHPHRVIAPEDSAAW